jgi:CSLREA domain-containing protein
MRLSTRLLTVGALIVGVMGVPLPAQAATIAVNTAADEVNSDGDCSLREAIIAANSDGASDNCAPGTGVDTITVPSGTYTLSVGPAGDDASLSGDLDVTDTDLLTIKGSGARTTVIDGAGVGDRLFQVLPGAQAEITDVTIRNGHAPATDCGGGVFNSGTLTLRRVAVTGSQADCGGGITSAVMGSPPTLTLIEVLVGGNATDEPTNGVGGGITLESDTVAQLRNVTISGNTSHQGGGGVWQEGGTATLNNVTIADNAADSDANGSGDGGGIQVAGGTAAVSNTIIGDNDDRSTGTNPRAPDCAGTLQSGGYNFIENLAGCTVGGVAAGNITNKNPQLFALADNGGPTQTHALRKGSDAVDAGNPAAPGSGPTACETTDQRGIPRPQGARCDIGSFERAQPSEVTCLGKRVTLTGTPGDDVLTGTAKRDVIRALGGDDVIDALGGNDRVCAGAGNDRINGRSGADIVAGGPGNDRIKGAGGDDDLRGQGGRDRLKGKGGDDVLRGQGGRDRLKGKGGDDVLRGGPKPDNLNGGGGFDTCRGGGGRDRVRRCEA